MPPCGSPPPALNCGERVRFQSRSVGTAGCRGFLECVVRDWVPT